MNIFICGKRSFGTAVYTALRNAGHVIAGVAVPPPGKTYDKLHGFAVRDRIPAIVYSDKLVSAQMPDNIDLVIAAHAHHVISQKCIERSKHGAIGFHPSLLPRHRGADAVRWAVSFGDFVTGATVYWLNEKVDGGEIFLQRPIFIDRMWSYHDLWHAIFPVGIELILEAVSRIETGGEIHTPQDERFATWEPSWERTRLHRTELAAIEWSPIWDTCKEA